MAASYISVPRDLTKVKSKVMFNLTKRQLICFGMAALIGVPSFFLLKTVVKVNTAVMGMMAIMMPFFFLAMRLLWQHMWTGLISTIILFSIPPIWSVTGSSETFGFPELPCRDSATLSVWSMVYPSFRRQNRVRDRDVPSTRNE